jgi:hypothetical protein
VQFRSLSSAKALFVASLLLFGLAGSGCSTGVVDRAQAGTIPSVDAAGQSLLEYLSQALPADTVQQMRADRTRILEGYPPGVNVLSTAQYGTRMLEGKVDLGDVFDARVPANALAFQTWAEQQGLVASEYPEEHVSIYSDAAAAFVVEYQYDAVLFFPDEFHPVFTCPTDTWLFLRENPQPGGPPTDFRSSRVLRRKVTLGGGFPMAPSPLTGLFYFYFPSSDQSYSSYQFLEGPENSSVPGSYVPTRGDAVAQQRRRDAGHVASNLSNRSSVTVGAWMSETDAQMNLVDGLLVREDPVIYTWSGDGLYLLALESDFWVLPAGAKPSPNGGTLPQPQP